MAGEIPDDPGTAPKTDTMTRTDRLLFAALPLALSCAAAAQRTPDEALRALQEGNRRFAGEHSVPQPIGPGVRRTLSRGQSPYAVVVTCADSRVPPEHLFNVGLGELVVVRTAGHVLGPEAIATIEHAVERLNVPLCVVLGHEHCDVVAAAAEQTHATDTAHQPSAAVVHLLERIEPAVRKARALDLGGKQLHDMAEEEHAHGTVQECMRRSPLLRRFASVGRFRMVAARYHQGGDVEWLPSRPLPKPELVDRPALPGTVPPSLPPHVALRMLRAGHRRFLGDSRPMPDLSRQQREALADAQQPLAIVVTDSDSRVSPEHIFDAGLGELYVVRVAGNTMTDETLASVEFAAEKLGASLLVVMGHSRCASIVAAADDPTSQQMSPHQRHLLRSLEPAVITAREQHAQDLVAHATRENVIRTLHEARSRSALLRTLEQEGRFAMLAGYYDVASGDLAWLKVPAPSGRAVASRSGGAGHGTDSHEGHGHDPKHGHAAHDDDHGSGGHAEHDHGALPVIDFPAPIGETAHAPDGHGSPGHDDHGHTSHAHGDHGHADHGHADQSHADHHADHGHADHDHAADGHDAADHDSHGGDGHGHGDEANGHGDWLQQTLEHAKNPIVLGGLGGMTALLAAAWLVLRRKR
jgi:carbonic anhydrase